MQCLSACILVTLWVFKPFSPSSPNQVGPKEILAIKRCMRKDRVRSFSLEDGWIRALVLILHRGHLSHKVFKELVQGDKTSHSELGFEGRHSFLRHLLSDTERVLSGYLLMSSAATVPFPSL